MECIFDSREAKKTRHKTYFEHLVKWQGLPKSEAIWMVEEDIKNKGGDLQQLVSNNT